MQLDGQFRNGKRGFERRHVLVGRFILQLVAEIVRSQPEVVAKKQLGRVTSAGVGHWKTQTQTIEAGGKCEIRYPVFRSGRHVV